LPTSLLKPLLAAACAASLAVVSGCGEEQSRGGTVPGDTLTIFSSLPLQGAHAAQAQSIVNAEKLALRDSGGRVGEFKINFASADDSTAGGDRVGWDPDKTAENGRKAVENVRTIAYIGELDSGATAVSLPITN
jgi:branched-chain amino acid transport system substrate-binding protein